ncbi:response regulator [Marinitoga sp. 1138]|uniref:response regulator n=1 Tax=Marinitoga sp. 1138 TaxID=1643334 RepID=UPI001586A31D|nr:hypothetical protein [Marinitoga sp. 1138]
MTAIHIDDSKLSLKLFKKFFLKVFPDFTINSYTPKEYLSQRDNLGDFDIIITDLLMPEISGFEIVEDIYKNFKSTKGIFLVVMSSNIQDAVKSELFEKGVKVFIEKPITLDKMKILKEEFEKWNS